MRDINSQTEHNESKDTFVQTELGDTAVDKDVHIENTGDTFVKYPYKYCGTNIANSYLLFEHKVKCCGTYSMRTDPGLPISPCLLSSLQDLPFLHFYKVDTDFRASQKRATEV